MLVERLQADLTAAMKERDARTTAVLRMALAAVKEAAVAGDSARQLSDEEVVAVLAREAKRREEAAAAFTEAGRTDRAEAERDVLARYLPAAHRRRARGTRRRGPGRRGPRLADADGAGHEGRHGQVAGRAEGRRVADVVKAKLAGG